MCINKSTLRWNPSRWKSSQIWVMCWICLHTYMIMNPVAKRRKASNVTNSKIITCNHLCLVRVMLLISLCLLLFLPTKHNKTNEKNKNWGKPSKYPPVIQSSQIVSQPPDPARLLMEVKVSLCRFPNLKSARVNQLLRLGINSSHL